MKDKIAWWYMVTVVVILGGCATTPASFKPIQSVDRAVEVSCIDRLPEPPKLHTDAEIKAMRDYDATIALRADRILSEIYIAKLETTLEGCK